MQVEYETEPGKLYTFKYPIAGTDDHLPVATTRPETIPGDTAVAVNPEDERFKHWIGKQCEVPLAGRFVAHQCCKHAVVNRPCRGHRFLHVQVHRCTHLAR